MLKRLIIGAYWLGLLLAAPANLHAQVIGQPQAGYVGPVTAGDCAQWNDNLGNLKDSGSAACGGGSGNVTGPASATSGHVATYNGTTGKIIQDGGALPAGANPSATAGPSANNGSATTFMRSDASPAVQVGTTSQEGLLQPDGSTIAVNNGVISVAPSVATINIPPCSTWTTLVDGGSGGPSCTNVSGLGAFFDAGTLQGTNAVRADCVNIPGSTWTVTTSFKFNGSFAGGSAGYVALTDGTKFLLFGPRLTTASGTLLAVDYYSNSTTYSSSDISDGYWRGAPYLRIKYDGTNFSFFDSWDGSHFALELKEAASVHTITATQICVATAAFSSIVTGNDTSLAITLWNATTP